MRFLEINEVWDWCSGTGFPLDDRARLVEDPTLSERVKWLYATGERSGREPALAADAVHALGEWDECLLWVTEWGVWPSGEDWPRYYAARGALGERRSLESAPAQLFAPSERALLIEFLTQAMENGWDAWVLPASDDRPTGRRLRISHDEWLELATSQPVEFPRKAV
jgi:hypothetical protein